MRKNFVRQIEKLQYDWFLYICLIEIPLLHNVYGKYKYTCASVTKYGRIIVEQMFVLQINFRHKYIILSVNLGYRTQRAFVHVICKVNFPTLVSEVLYLN